MAAKQVEIQAAFDLGVAAARDPVNRAAIRGGPATTSLQSPWLFNSCPVCAHTFRLGDHVLIDDHGQIRHNSALLPCAGLEVSAPPAPAEIGEFYTGLDRTWPPPQGVPLHRLEFDNDLLAVTIGRRLSCSVCAHTLRPHDQVVICPCSPAVPKCRIVLHRDPLHGLNCWDVWCPDGKPKYCLATSRTL